MNRPVDMQPCTAIPAPPAVLAAVLLVTLALGAAGCAPAGADPETSGQTRKSKYNRDNPDELIAELDETLADLQQRLPLIVDEMRIRRLALVRTLADLRREVGRSGQSLQQLRDEMAQRPNDLELQAIRRKDRRCAELQIQLAKLVTGRKQLEGLVTDHEYVVTDLKSKRRIAQLIDPELLRNARELLDRVESQHDLSPSRILENPDVALQFDDAEKKILAEVDRAILPERPEQSLSDLPELPKLDMTPQGQAEEFLLADLRDHLEKGRTEAQQHLAAHQPEAAIERLHEALRQIRGALDAFPKSASLAWRNTCLQELDTCRDALSKSLAGPYLEAIDRALPEARKTGDWSAVLDLLDAAVRLAPGSESLPEKIDAVETILEYRKNANDDDAAVAAERLKEIRGRRNGIPPGTIPVTTSAPPKGDLPELKTAWQAAQNAFAEACLKSHRDDLALRGLLLKYQPKAPAVVQAEQVLAQVLAQDYETAARLLAARDRVDAQLAAAIEVQIGERQAARQRLTGAGLGLREDAAEVREVDGQIAALKQRQEPYLLGAGRAAGKGKPVEIKAFAREPANLVRGEVNSVGMTLVRIPAGSFTLGSPENESGRDNDEGQVRVTISKDFLFAAHETTVEQVLVWLNDPKVQFDASWITLADDDSDAPIRRTGSNFVFSGSKFGRAGTQPMVFISHGGATAFCVWLSQREGRNYHLPSEAQWEYAHRAGTPFPAQKLGDEIDPDRRYRRGTGRHP